MRTLGSSIRERLDSVEAIIGREFRRQSAGQQRQLAISTLIIPLLKRNRKNWRRHVQRCRCAHEQIAAQRVHIRAWVRFGRRDCARIGSKQEAFHSESYIERAFQTVEIKPSIVIIWANIQVRSLVVANMHARNNFARLQCWYTFGRTDFTCKSMKTYTSMGRLCSSARRSSCAHNSPVDRVNERRRKLPEENREYNHLLAEASIQVNTCPPLVSPAAPRGANP